MKHGRIVVVGTYLNDSTYVLRKEDGNIFLTIREGEAFYVGEKNIQWIPVKIQRYDGKGTLLKCVKRDAYGRVIGEFILTDNKKGLWAISDKSARGGVFHKCKENQDVLDKELALRNIGPKKIHILEFIDHDFQIGKVNNNKAVKPYSFGIITDGEQEVISAIKNGLKFVRVFNATYVIYVLYRYKRAFIQCLYLTNNVDREKVASIIKRKA